MFSNNNLHHFYTILQNRVGDKFADLAFELTDLRKGKKAEFPLLQFFLKNPFIFIREFSRSDQNFLSPPTI